MKIRDSLPMLLISMAVVILMTVKEGRTERTFTSADGESVSQHDCECKNHLSGKFCGGSKYLESLNNTGCRKNVLFTCTAAQKYIQDVDFCIDEYVCKPDTGAEGKDACTEGPPGPNDCGCKKDVDAGLYCGGSKKYLEDKSGLGCRDEHIYTCNKGGGIAKNTETCKEYYECTSAKPGKADCTASPPDDADCKCNNEKKGFYCGGDKNNLINKNGLGCQRNYRFYCNDFGKQNNFYPETITKCPTGQVCVSSAQKPNEAKCVKKK